jgi:hypothetical protein
MQNLWKVQILQKRLGSTTHGDDAKRQEPELKQERYNIFASSITNTGK